MEKVQNIRQNSSLKMGDKANQLRGITLVAIATALALVGMKALAWLATGSIALLGSLIDSILDLMISTVNFFVVQHALTPADREHRFGHGKAEALAALTQGMVISVSAVFLGYESYQRFIEPTPMEGGNIGIAVIVVAIIMTLGLVTMQKKVARDTGSLAIAADSQHYRGDLFMNLGVIGAIVLTTYGGLTYADPVLGVVVMLILLNSAREIFVEAAHQLMDHELPEAERKRIKDIILAHPETKGLHDLRTRASGTQKFIQCHVELDETMTLLQAHDISDEIEENVTIVFPEAEVIIHQDPAGHEELTKLEKS